MTGRWDHLVRAAIDVPCGERKERATWIARNFCELLIHVKLSKYCLQGFDDLVLSFDLSLADHRICDRLREFRGLLGTVPLGYPAGCNYGEYRPYASPDYVASSKVLCDFADVLKTYKPKAESPPRSPMRGAGADAISNRRSWRPTILERSQPAFIEAQDWSSRFIRRGWVHLEDHGPAMVVVDQDLDIDRLDVWWGIHNGCHLDLLAWHSKETPEQIEFGAGMIVAEALCVSVELLAGAEALSGLMDVSTQTIADGLIERAGRLPLPVNTGFRGISYDKAAALSNTEFHLLPTIAEAYVIAPLKLLSSGFTSPFIPPLVSQRLTSRFQVAGAQSKEVQTFLQIVSSMSFTTP